MTSSASVGGNVPERLIANLDVQITAGCSLCLPYQLKEDILVELLDVIATVKFLIIDSVVGEQKYRIIQNILKHDITSDKEDSAKDWNSLYYSI